ncbi:peptidase S8 and S53 subtilisin kexin sedolisin [Natrialba chahannaoensis JCM 10990]|uniref:Peptidase S8 and S53 subtilisin kexin sedolisin n=1 Tax=Natrialba chahannaoensis JCM 10990 TaxID=1227492 RepID=M0AS97_9EURY|nr:S8 family peptidase [Natrialba chahannaoensis]ELZ01566.1 peptidase S8 and S53 subtilisin kexin sedolisin [Natrialba chahannaoensis JCM 10990]
MSDEMTYNGTGRRSVLKAVSGAGITLGGLASVSSVQADSSGDAGRFNVGYVTEVGEQQIRDAADNVVHAIHSVNTLTVEAADEGMEPLTESDHIDFVAPDQAYYAGSDVDDNNDNSDGQVVPWGVERIGARKANKASKRGKGANVAVINTGIDPTHPDLAANLGDGIAYTRASAGHDTNWADDNGHGTHVSGTIAALDNDFGVVGVAPKSTLHAVKVLNEDGVGFASDVAMGIIWSAITNRDVANMSLSGPYSPLVQRAIQFAHKRGVLLISSAGNDGGAVSYPASAPEVVAVSATTQDDGFAAFSNYGPEIELAAPGVDILSTLPSGEYGIGTGTSFATPHVTGTAALLMAKGYSATEARYFMNKTATDIGLPTEQQGAGLVNAAAVAKITKKSAKKGKKDAHKKGKGYGKDGKKDAKGKKGTKDGKGKKDKPKTK